jgi:hypothetical protein
MSRAMWLGYPLPVGWRHHRSYRKSSRHSAVRDRIPSVEEFIIVAENADANIGRLLRKRMSDSERTVTLRLGKDENAGP